MAFWLARDARAQESTFMQRFDPRFWTVNFPRPAMASVVTTAPDALQIEVVGHQWWWEFKYPQLGITTANELYLPNGRTVNFQLKTIDVLHSQSRWPSLCTLLISLELNRVMPQS